MKIFISAFTLLLCGWAATAQEFPKDITVAKAEVIDSDTIPTFNIREVVIFHREFDNEADRLAFERLKRNTIKVYPYVEIAVALYNDMQEEMNDINRRRKKKKYVNEKENELREKFEADIRKMSKTQGQILIKLINRETGNNCYEIVKDMKGPFTAFFWNMAGKMYDHDLKADYIPEDNQDLEYIVRMIKDETLQVKSLK